MVWASQLGVWLGCWLARLGQGKGMIPASELPAGPPDPGRLSAAGGMWG